MNDKLMKEIRKKIFDNIDMQAVDKDIRKREA